MNISHKSSDSSISLWPSLMAQMVKNLPAMQETQVWSLGQEDSLEKEMTRKWQPTPIFLPREYHGLLGYSPWSCKQSDTAEWLTLATILRIILIVYEDNSSKKSCQSVIDCHLLLGLSWVQVGSGQVYGDWKSRKTSWFEVLILNRGHFFPSVFPGFQSLWNWPIVLSVSFTYQEYCLFC